MLDNHLDIFQCYSNLIKPHSALTIENINGVKDIERTLPIIWDSIVVFDRFF